MASLRRNSQSRPWISFEPLFIAALIIALAIAGLALFIEFRYLPKTKLGKRAFLTREITAVSAAIGDAKDRGAKALEAYLLSPVTQARIREVRYPGATHCTWTPGGRHNRTAMLPKT